MKKKLAVLSLLAVCAAVAVSGTLAYFTSEDTAHNVITSGGVSIELVEKTKENGTEVEFPEDGLTGIMPGTSASKIVSVKNTGEADAWIRVSVNIGITAAEKSGLHLSGPGAPMAPVCLPLTVTDAEGNEIPVVSFTVKTEEYGGNWIYNADDDCYYYKDIVKPDEVTDVLFDEVTFAKEMGNEYQNCTVTIDVAAHAVQSDNNPIPDGGTVADIPGWPEA